MSRLPIERLVRSGIGTAAVVLASLACTAYGAATPGAGGVQGEPLT
jgi:hypothetical protein